MCVCLCIPPSFVRQRLRKNPLIVARQRLCKNVTAVTNTHATIEELLDASFSMSIMSAELTFLILVIASQSHITTDGQSVMVSSPIWVS
jgi:hypothetical protein